MLDPEYAESYGSKQSQKRRGGFGGSGGGTRLVHDSRRMPYVRDGAVVTRRTPWRLSIVTDVFWTVVNLVAAFFQSMLDPEYAESYGSKQSQKRRGGFGGSGGGGLGGPGSGGGGTGSGGGRPGGNVHGASRIRGLDHSAPQMGG
eukprot:CAMPEP_0119223832 /NCGR_PEP_ID=MMETSP1327-20130426/33363_1 /TAXON_ID=38833 /ORGANISM="Micromonas pusilla, Strain RCC2306" /LENGTH=144 /DNA_ID=CAMNT_0007222109 /DNA_START=284 /DNA_END=718 /DNA_ORIENTATION=-